MSKQIVIRASRVAKGFRSYDLPANRLKQAAFSAASRMLPGASREYARARAAAYGSVFWALNDVSFAVAKGETIGIIGRNGSGKSTLLQIVCQTLSPSRGSIETVGRVAALLELGSGFDLEYTGRENVYLNAQLHGLTRRQVDERLDRIIEFADIGEFIDQPVKTYSSGMFVRLAFAVIAHVDADILVVDEALAVGDAFFNQKCLRYMDQFRKKGTILFVSHDTSTVKKLCSRVIWIDKGEVRLEGDPDEVCEAYLDAYFDTAPAPAVQADGARPAQKRVAIAAPVDAKRDARLSTINRTPCRNDIEILRFEPHAASFGSGAARIVDVRFVDRENRPLSWVVGGEDVTLRVSAFVNEDVRSPIVGFFFNDHLGQSLFGENTYLTYRDKHASCGAGDTLVASFSFAMPLLPAGEYSVNVAIADGTQQSHVQLHWIHDALPIRVHASSVANYLLAVPMLRVGVSAAANA
ncbi:ABC transporter family protein [Burkholderia thailandensis MSMB121]|uniref:Putative ABC transporter, ATP-binding protein n=1 Tax=Burkholderia humptydooensis TaxID=430531 RepID=G3FNG3_9BURK|nr:ABC transporter ATP-binding protein [Burkholderia humptydooensis]AGK48931.1 ABC transporter family protein [Burkholderia thailandensis MSMB121]ATF37615.1 ABC transporter ATP-binding protein [Burkholderia thailandensis]ADZ55347.1 putative polysaccharide ABC transporter/ATP-binding protein [Burkholderia humptydooensis]AEO78272.1 putative ABC transporter, ATP-binding protein [Burkholderia humptydooensis]KST75923.1 ABC transporter ATP-binding protein [Burkholderia humptydooensis]